MDELTTVNETTSLEAVLEGKKSFAIQSKSWFLTYPKCPLSKEEGMQLLKAKLAGKTIRGIVVAAELHKDGTNHLHAYILLAVALNCRNARYWDIGAHHGNYQKARDINAVVQYIKKDGNILEEGDISWAEKVDAKKDHRRALTKAIIDGSMTIPQAVDEGLLNLHDLEKVNRGHTLYRQLKLTALTTSDTRGIWIYGPPGTGKTHMVRTSEPHLYLKAQNKWWDGYIDQPAVLIDDMDNKGACLSHYIKIWADKWGSQGETKGGHTPLLHERFYVTSNFTIAEVFRDEPIDTIEAIERRFKVIHKVDRDLGLDGYYPEEPVLGKRKTIFVENN